jgi:hypothetical protein
MPEVCLKPFNVVKVDDDEILACVRHGLLVTGAVGDATADADRADTGNVANGALERVHKGPAIFG